MALKKRSKKVLIGLVVLVVITQLLQPTKNVSTGESANDISKAYQMPVEVSEIFTQKCYDCHSNNTRYPWWINIQPIGWWMASHISDAKARLNFSEFKTYSEARAALKLEKISDAVTQGWMPLDAYVWMHSEAKITPEDSKKINAWIESIALDGKQE